MPEFDFDIKKKEWRPSCVNDLVQELGRSFGATVTLNDLHIEGTDYMQKQRIKTEDDLKKWLKTESKTYEKFIKIKVPDRLLPKDWEPKKMMVLAPSKKNVLAQYFGDEEVSTRQVQLTLKILDCGHFRLKQTLQGSGPSPYWVIFEGRWKRTPRGFRLEFCIRYPFQKSKKRDEFDLCFEAMPDIKETTLSFSDEAERQLAGQLPAIVGSELTAWIELVQEHDKESVPKARFNVEDAEDVASEASKPVEGQRPEEASKTSRNSPSSSVSTAPQQAPAYKESCSVAEDGEPAWPLYVGLVVFLVLVLSFSWNYLLQPPSNEL